MTTPTYEPAAYPAAMPPQLRAFAENNVGLLAEATDCSWPVDRSKVWRITNWRGTTWYLKQHPSVKLHAREVHAYARWTVALGPGRAPDLLAADPGLSAIIVSSVAGDVVSSRKLPEPDELEVHRQLGELLRALHTAEPERPAIMNSPSPDLLERKLELARPHLDDGQGPLIRSLAGRLITLGGLPHVPTHGDPQLRNALWDGQRRRLALIDFERAGYASAVHDLVRLEYGPWDRRPDLRAAFANGYGRSLSGLETETLQIMAALDALSGIVWGTGTGDHEVVSRGHRTLNRILFTGTP